VPLARISDQLRTGTVDIEVDISDCTQNEREAATTVLMNMKGLDSPRAGDTVENALLRVGGSNVPGEGAGRLGQVSDGMGTVRVAARREADHLSAVGI